jgi:signal recognition particle subunit SEC65
LGTKNKTNTFLLFSSLWSSPAYPAPSTAEPDHQPHTASGRHTTSPRSSNTLGHTIMSKTAAKRTGRERISHIYISDELIGKPMESIPDYTRWATIYPAYIDSTRTLKQGRRINKELCFPGPNPIEIFYCCKQLKIPCVTELGSYPRSPWDQEPSHAEYGKGLGRIRVQLLTDDGQTRTTPDDLEPKINSGEAIATRTALLKFICKLLPDQREELKLHLRPDPNIPPIQKQTKKNALEDGTPGSGKKKKKKGKKGKRNR